jgi:hypothetical protein
LLPGGAIQFPGGSFFPAVDQRLFTAHRKIPITLIYLGSVALIKPLRP